MRIYRLDLSAGDTVQIEAVGRCVRGISGSARYELALDGAAPTQFETGIAYESPRQFSKVTLSSSVDQVVEVAISAGAVSDNRMVGRVDITGGIDSNILTPASIATGSASVAVTASQLVPANDDRASLLIVPVGGKIYVGDAGVTVSTGIPVTGSFTLQSRAALHAVSEFGPVDVRWMEEVK